MTARQIEMERDFLGFEPDPSELMAMEEELEVTTKSTAKQRPAARPERDTGEVEIDRILAKIAKSGIESLTEAEHKTLQRATDEKRGRGGA